MGIVLQIADFLEFVAVNVLVPKLKNTFWVQGLMLALVLLVVGWMPEAGGILSSVKERLMVLLARLGPGGLVLLLIPMVFPVMELILQQSHLGAYYVFSRKHIAYRLLASVLAVLLIYTAIVFGECVLFLFVEERFPIDFGPVAFWSGWTRMWVADLPLAVVILAGEILRQAIYQSRILSHYRLMQERITEI